MMIDASDVFNPKDFESIKLLVHFSNITTRTEVKDASSASLVEVGDRTLILELPEKSCNIKHSVMVEIEKFDKNKTTSKPLLSVTGKIVDVEDVGEKAIRATIDCIQFDEQSWRDLLALYSSRQDEINQFLAAAKG